MVGGPIAQPPDHGLSDVDMASCPTYVHRGYPLMMEEERTAKLVQRLRHRDSQAEEEVFDRYARQLTRYAEQHLSQKIARRVGGSDIVQSTFRTFFRRTADGEFQIDSSAQIWRLLVKITLQKTRAKARYHTAERRSVDAELASIEATSAHVFVPEPGPAEAALLADEIEHLLHGLPDLYCRVLEMRLEGNSAAEIATRLGVSRQTVYRALRLLQHRLSDSRSPKDTG